MVRLGVFNMKCSKCGKEYSTDFNYCPNCGAINMDNNACPSCGNTYNSDDKFCANCGNKRKVVEAKNNSLIFLIVIIFIIGCTALFFAISDNNTFHTNNNKTTTKQDSINKKTQNKVEEKTKSCSEFGITVISYQKHGYYVDVILKNNNDCYWDIKSYSKVRVYFTDSSYEDVYLGTNINLGSKESYTFNNCYLDSNNKYKDIRIVSFIV